jgi:hypothetical protein
VGLIKLRSQWEEFMQISEDLNFPFYKPPDQKGIGFKAEMS